MMYETAKAETEMKTVEKVGIGNPNILVTKVFKSVKGIFSRAANNINSFFTKSDLSPTDLLAEFDHDRDDVDQMNLHMFVLSDDEYYKISKYPILMIGSKL
ncbi:hypothetical protein CsatA_005357 [Cannabis sativa]